jgi:hypothetical protein
MIEYNRLYASALAGASNNSGQSALTKCKQIIFNE